MSDAVTTPHRSSADVPSGRVDEGPLLLYDGVCAFCNGAVQFVLRRDPGGRMRFAPLEGEAAAGIRARHPGLEGVDSLVLVVRDGTRESVAVRSDAALGVASYLGGPWRLLGVTRVIPRRLRDWAYDVFARNRYRWFGQLDACPIPPEDVRHRFLP